MRIHQWVARRLGSEIVTGRIQPGEALGGEIEAAEKLGVSRAAYREAIRSLAAKGLIDSRPKSGTHVLPRRRWNLLDPDVLAWMFSTGQPDPAFLRDLFELRAIIEPSACALAAVRRSDAHLAAMAAGLAGMRAHGLAAPEGQLADKDFHAALLDAAGNDALTSLSESVSAAVRWTTYYKARHSPDPRDSLPEHEAVYAAIVAGDGPAAAEAMRDLLRLAISDMGSDMGA